MNYSDFISIVTQLSQGVANTLLVTLTCFFTATVTGIIATFLPRLNIPGIRFFLNGFAFIFRSIPLLVLIFLVYFGLPTMGFKIHPIMAMNLSLGIIAGAYLYEVFRGALKSIDSAELLAAKAMGMTSMQIFLNIEFPQMLRLAFPGIVNEFTTILKNSAFAYTIGISEITRQALALTSTTNFGVSIYIIVGFLYFFIYRICLFCMKLAEKKFSFSVEAIR